MTRNEEIEALLKRLDEAEKAEEAAKKRMELAVDSGMRDDDILETLVERFESSHNKKMDIQDELKRLKEGP